MKRITLVLGVVALMVAVMVALSAPAMAKGNGGNKGGGNSGSSFKSSGSSFNSGGGTHFSGSNFGGSSWSSGSSWSWNDGFSDVDVDQEAVSGDIDFETDISLSGDNSNQAAPVVQFGNTGNNQNALVVDQFGSEVEDFEFEGGFISFEPEFEFAADQEIQQSSAA